MGGRANRQWCSNSRTVGPAAALANHIWSFAGESDRAEVNATYLQPFVSFTTKKATTFTLNTESTYDWHGGQWSVPMNFMVQQLVKIGKQPIALTVGARYYPEGPSQGPDWGLRFAVIFLFPICPMNNPIQQEQAEEAEKSVSVFSASSATSRTSP